jgi:hypothetical protein
VIKTGLVNILCGNELIIAQIVDEKQNLYKSLNIIMGDVNVFDVIEAKRNENGILEMVAIVEEGVPHKKLYHFDNMDDWRQLCIEANKHSDKCILQGLTKPKGATRGVVIIAFVSDFDPIEHFSELIKEIPEE